MCKCTRYILFTAFASAAFACSAVAQSERAEEHDASTLTLEDLWKLVNDPDRSKALLAAWKIAVYDYEGGILPNDVGSEMQRFLGIVEGRLRALPPAWEAVLQQASVNGEWSGNRMIPSWVYLFPTIPEEKMPTPVAPDYKLRKVEKGRYVIEQNEAYSVEFSTEDYHGVGSGERVVVDESTELYLLYHRSLFYRFPVVCIKDNKVVWVSTVDSSSTAIPPMGLSIVWLEHCILDNELLLFGNGNSASYMYIHGIDLATGDQTFRFCTYDQFKKTNSGDIVLLDANEIRATSARWRRKQ